MPDLDSAGCTPLALQLAAEATGSFVLFATAVGPGVMAQRLSAGHDGVALLANAIAIGAICSCSSPCWRRSPAPR